MPRAEYMAAQLRQAAGMIARSAGMPAEGLPVQRASDGTAYQLAMSDDATQAEIFILGDVCEWAIEPWGEMDAPLLSKKLQEMPEGVESIAVHINSYGGSVKEGVAIHNMLKAHPAQVTTICEGMACSIASVIFMAGDRRVMREASELMVHNAWACAVGNASELRKAADDLEKHNELSVRAYMARVSITEQELRALMDAETWVTAQEALEWGFATEVDGAEPEGGAMASARPAQAAGPERGPEQEAEPEPEPETEPEAAPEPVKDAEQKAGANWPAVVAALKAAM